MEKKLYEVITPADIAQYWENSDLHQNDALIGTQFFPLSKQVGLELEWIKGYNQIGVALQPAAFDTRSPIRDRIGFEAVQAEMPIFRESTRLGEKERQQLATMLQANPKMAMPLLSRIYDDVAQLIIGARVQRERMMMQLLASGKISIAADDEKGRNVNLDYNYDTTGEWEANNVITLTGDKQWKAENAATFNPLEDIENVIEHAQEDGVTPTTLLMTSKTKNAMLKSDAIKKAVSPVGNENRYFTKTELEQYLKDTLNISIITHDAVYKASESSEAQKYFPDGVVTFLPSGAVGTMVHGTTPEEFDLMNSAAVEGVQIVETGVSVTTVKEAHPVNVQTHVTSIMLPSFERMNEVYVLHVDVEEIEQD